SMRIALALLDAADLVQCFRPRHERYFADLQIGRKIVAVLSKNGSGPGIPISQLARSSAQHGMTIGIARSRCGRRRRRLSPLAALLSECKRRKQEEEENKKPYSHCKLLALRRHAFARAGAKFLASHEHGSCVSVSTAVLCASAFDRDDVADLHRRLG